MISQVDDRYVDVAIASRSDSGRPYFHRRFDRHETREIRVFMWGGDDRAVVRSESRLPITVRVIGGQGDDELVDSTRTGGARFYDADSETISPSRKTHVDAKPYDEWIGSDLNRYPPRDWGRQTLPATWLAGSPDLGLFFGLGFNTWAYGFRQDPFASHMLFRAGYATAASTGRAEFEGEFHLENSSVFTTIHARASGLEILHYYGLGNETVRGATSTFFKVKQQQYTLDAAVVLPVSHRVSVSLGPTGGFFHTPANTGTFISTIRDTLYGTENLLQVGGHLGLQLDTRDRTTAPTRGLRLAVRGRVFPSLFDVESTFGTLDGEAATYLSAPIITAPTLALRVGGKKVFGAFPFYESAFIGGATTLRGFDAERFAGDAAIYGGGELRLRLAKLMLLLPGDFGVLGFAETGRVYVDGNSPGGWHSAGGGGIWFAFLDSANTISVHLARSAERTAVYLQAGFTM